MQKTPKTELDLTLFPYMQSKKKGIEARHQLTDLLNLRKELAKSSWSILSAFERNERKILLLQTEFELGSNYKKIHDLQLQFDERINSLVELIAEMDDKWDYIMSQGEKLRKKLPDLEEYLQVTDKSNFETNMEEKLSYYIRVRGYVNPPKAAMRIHRQGESDNAAPKE